MIRSIPYKRELAVVFGLLLSSVIYAQHPSIGGYHVYYGNLHNHTSYSDGAGTPYQAYSYAKDISGLDFLGLADHADYLTAAEWADTKAQANSSSADGIFCGLLWI